MKATVDILNEAIENASKKEVAKLPGQNRYLNHLYHLKQRLCKGQKLTKKMSETLAAIKGRYK